jgi:hypothetical protein
MMNHCPLDSWVRIHRRPEVGSENCSLLLLAQTTGFSTWERQKPPFLNQRHGRGRADACGDVHYHWIDRGDRYTGRARVVHDLVDGVTRSSVALLVEGGDGDIEVSAHRLVAGVHFSAGRHGAGSRLRGCPRPRGGRCRQGPISRERGGVALGVEGIGLARTGFATGGTFGIGLGATKYCPRYDRAR